MGTPADELIIPEMADLVMGSDAAFAGAGELSQGAQIEGAISGGLEGGGAAAGAEGAVSGVDAINAAAPGTIAKGLTDAEVAGSVFAPAAAGGAAGAAIADSTVGDTVGSGPATTQTAVTPPDSTTQTLAQQTLESGVSPEAQATQAGLDQVGAANQGLAGAGELALPGTATGAPPGLIEGGLAKFAKENPQLSAAALQAMGLGVAGAASGAGKVMAEQRKAELELENKKKLAQFYRDFIQSGSQGGIGVNVNLRPGLIGSRT